MRDQLAAGLHQVGCGRFKFAMMFCNSTTMALTSGLSVGNDFHPVDVPPVVTAVAMVSNSVSNVW
ncbi:hypothetical protein [Pelobacter seleniigenes]|uniref:hypothetical protein n=1 Tax=Pelobacter seleniigenes TaxID=407188 RepID=UPI0004A75A85|nr:hypothetical protein [Pelobacter seleniigenes]